MDECVFCKIITGKLPRNVIYEDEEIVVFPSNRPEAPIHLLYMPRKHVKDLTEATDDIVLKIKNKILDKINELGLKNKSYRIQTNGGSAQEIKHLHFHLLGEVV